MVCWYLAILRWIYHFPGTWECDSRKVLATNHTALYYACLVRKPKIHSDDEDALIS